MRVQLATLRLRDGNRVATQMPGDEVTARAVGVCVNTPADAPDLKLSFKSPENQPIELHAREIVGIEMDPPYCLIENFLSPEEVERAMAHALAHEAEFRDSTVSLVGNQGEFKPDYELRRSRILDNVADVAPMIGQALFKAMPRIFAAIGMPPINFRSMELQLSAHGDGDYFNTHTDNGLPDIAHRTVTYVYYFPPRTEAVHRRASQALQDRDPRRHAFLRRPRGRYRPAGQWPHGIPELHPARGHAHSMPIVGP
jgi:hypothetical protein